MTYIKKKKMMEEILTVTHKLSEVIGNMQKCLKCRICLHIISEPVKTQCRHRFCRPCIERVLQDRKALCPLCYTVIHPRSVTKDEHMVLWVDRLQKLIQAVKLDTGIDVLAHLSRPRSGQERYQQNPTEYSKSDYRESIKPDCSNYSTSLPKNLVDSRSNQTTKGKRKAPKGRKGKNKYFEKPENSISQYLSKCPISGVELLPPDEPDDCGNEKSVEEKVHSWLDNLPKMEIFDDPNKVTLGESVECNLDDTLTISVSQNDCRNEVETADRNSETIVKETKQTNKRRTMAKQSSWSSIFQENDVAEMNDKKKDRNKSEIDVNMDNQNPSTSRVTKSRDVSGERSLEISIDIHKTSPCDLLPTMKQNWTSVKEFGKEMHSKRKKKLKSLNVSIDSKNRHEAKSETVTNVSEKENDRSLTKDTGRRQGSKKVKASVGTRKSLDRHSIEKKQSSMNGEDVIEREPLAMNKNDRAMSKESSFIMLDEGEEMKIRNLNSCQLNDIIGIAGDTERGDIEKDTKTNSKKEHNNPPRTPLQDRFKNFPWETPLKQSAPREQESPINKRCEKQNNFSPSMLPHDEKGRREEEMSDISSRCTLQASNSSRKRLSLRKGSTDPKSNNCTTSYDDSRLQAVKRDLNLDIDQSTRSTDLNNRTTDKRSGTEQSVPSETSKPDGKQVRRSAGVSNKFTTRKEGVREGNESAVVFKKLGKTFKHRKKRVNFLYLGTNRRESLLVCNFPRPGVLKPCNPIDVSDREYPAAGFGNNAYFTVNYTPTGEASESGKRVEAALETSSRMSENKASSDSPLRTVQQSTSRKLIEMAKNAKTKIHCSDALDVSLDEKVDIFRPPTDRPAKSPKKFTINPVKLLSPGKDSQLQFLSLSSPEVENVRPRELIEPPEPVKDIGSFSEIKGVHSRALINTLRRASNILDEPSTPRKKKKISRSRENLSHRMKRKGDEESEDYCPSNLGNLDNEAPPIKRNKAIERCQASRIEDIDVVLLSSDTDSPEGRMRQQKKVYKRIVSLGSSDGSPVDVACVNKTANDQPVASQASKRKRDTSSDSEDETDLSVIANNWYEEAKSGGERCRKRGKLEETWNPSNSINAARNNSSSRSALNDRNQVTGKLADWQNRGPVPIARNSGLEKSQQVGTKRGQGLEARLALVVEDDSPNFSDMIEKVKDIRNREVASQQKRRESKEDYLMQDNFDEVIANVNTEILLRDCSDDKKRKAEGTLVKGSQKGWSDKNTSVNARRFGKVNVLASCSNFNKNNTYKESAPLFDDNENSFSSEYLSVTKKSFTKDKRKGKTKADQSIQPNNSMVHDFVISTDENKFPVLDVGGRDSLEQDSLLNITQHYLMMKQFEEDLFGKSNCSDAGFAKERTNQELRTPQTRKKKSLKVNRQDVEHSAEEDDIVENTPDIKTKNRCNHVTVSPKAESVSSSTVSPMFAVYSPMKSPDTSSMKYDVNSPAFRKKMATFHHSTPKVQQLVRRPNYSEAKTISTISDTDQTKNDIEKNVQSVDKSSRQRFCFVCSGLTSSQIEQVKVLAGSINAKYLTQFYHEVTHVIVKMEQNNRASKTLKYLQGIAHRKWIVSYQWVLDSLKERRLINEEPYEAVDSTTLEAGPRKSRLRDKALFEDFVFLCIGPYADVSVAQYQDLLRATGATVVDSLDSLVAAKKVLKIIVVQVDVHNDDIIGWYNKTHAIPVVHDWVVECVSQYKLISLYPYVQELSQQEVLALGFPDFLVEDEPDGDSDSLTNEST